MEEELNCEEVAGGSHEGSGALPGLLMKGMKIG
jgi:hypothetical protein